MIPTVGSTKVCGLGNVDMESLSPTFIWNAILTVLIAPVSYLVKGTIDRVSRLERDQIQDRVEVAKHYVTKVDLQTDLNRLFDRFDRLEQKLDKVITHR
jgi:hypothetical protein